jgi:hypothetical protein
MNDLMSLLASVQARHADILHYTEEPVYGDDGKEVMYIRVTIDVKLK